MRLLYPLAKRFIAGQSLDAAKKSIDKLISDGYEVTVDYIGEDSKTVPDCDKAFSQYVEIIKSYKGKKIDVSIKPSQLGIKIHPLISRTLLSDAESGYFFKRKIWQRWSGDSGEPAQVSRRHKSIS
jgi:hypothetical protein